jgi:hypothetical protein
VYSKCECECDFLNLNLALNPFSWSTSIKSMAKIKNDENIHCSHFGSESLAKLSPANSFGLIHHP